MPRARDAEQSRAQSRTAGSPWITMVTQEACLDSERGQSGDARGVVRRGTGLLVGAERRWLLLDDVPDEAFVATLWETIAGSGVDRVLGVLESHYGDRLPSLAMTGAGREIARGSGEVTSDRAGMMLSLGPPRLRGGRAATAVPRRGGLGRAGRDPGRRPGRQRRRPRADRRHPRRRAVRRRPRHPVRARQTARRRPRRPATSDPHPTGTRAPVGEVERDRAHRPDPRAARARPGARRTAATRWCARAAATGRRSPCPSPSSSCCASTPTRP